MDLVLSSPGIESNLDVKYENLKQKLLKMVETFCFFLKLYDYYHPTLPSHLNNLQQ